MHELLAERGYDVWIELGHRGYTDVSWYTYGEDELKFIVPTNGPSIRSVDVVVPAFLGDVGEVADEVEHRLAEEEYTDEQYRWLDENDRGWEEEDRIGA